MLAFLSGSDPPAKGWFYPQRSGSSHINHQVRQSLTDMAIGQSDLGNSSTEATCSQVTLVVSGWQQTLNSTHFYAAVPWPPPFYYLPLLSPSFFSRPCWTDAALESNSACMPEALRCFLQSFSLVCTRGCLIDAQWLVPRQSYSMVVNKYLFSSLSIHAE